MKTQIKFFTTLTIVLSIMPCVGMAESNNLLHAKGMVCTNAKEHHLLATYNDKGECIVRSCVVGYEIRDNTCVIKDEVKRLKKDIEELKQAYLNTVKKITEECTEQGKHINTTTKECK